MTTTYQKFHNPPSFATENGSNLVDPPSYPFPATPPSSVQPSPAILNGQPAGPFVQQPKKELKSLASLRRLVRIELILAVAMIIFEAIVDGVMSNVDFYGPCSLGTGVWVGVLGVIAAGLGCGAFRTQYGNKCLMVAHFVMSIICTVADGIMITFAGICLYSLPWRLRRMYDYRLGEYKDPTPQQITVVRGLLTAESLLLLAALTHFVSSIVSSALICRNWCQDSQPAVAVVYFPGTNQQSAPAAGSGGVESGGDPCRIAVPSGAHVQQYVIFVPMGNASGQAVYAPGLLTTTQQQPQPDFRNVPGLGDDKFA